MLSPEARLLERKRVGGEYDVRSSTNTHIPLVNQNGKHILAFSPTNLKHSFPSSLHLSQTTSYKNMMATGPSGTQSPPLEATGSHGVMGVSNIRGDVPEAVPDKEQRAGMCFFCLGG
jgi:hypothetical protein